MVEGCEVRPWSSMALGGQAVQAQPTTEDASKHAGDKRRVSQKQVFYRQSPERGAKQRAGGTVHPAGSSQHQEWPCEPLEAHQAFCV